MKNLFIILFSLLSLASFAQKKDSIQLKRTVFEAPTEINGFKVRYATLSKGKYQEIFSNDTIQQIGSVLFNRVTGEVVGEVIKDSLYFPADVVSRWWSIDPLAEKFPEQSPYIFADGNPILKNDPDGRDVIIYYKDENKKQQQFVLNSNTDFNKLPNNTFVKQTIAAYQYMQKNDGGKSFVKSVNDKDIKVGLVQSDKKQSYANGTILSPSNALDHEADHAYDDLKNPAAHKKRVEEKDEQYDTKEERRVITGTEQKTAIAFGEIKKGGVTRKDHEGTPVITISPTSNQINKAATYQYLMKLHKNKPYAGYNDKAKKYEK